MRSLAVALVCAAGFGWWQAPTLATAVPPSQGQRQDQPKPSGLILGQVVDADSGKGVPDVLVTIGAPAVASGIGELIDSNTAPVPTGATRRILTAADGRFLFRDLPKGRYMITTAAPGYVPGAYGKGRPDGPSLTLDLADAEKTGDVKIHVWKFAAISGTVVDERGEPAVGVAVRYFRRVIAGGHPRFANSTFVTTDDRGVYRMPNLVPGDYVIGVTVNQDTSPMAALLAGSGPSNGPSASPAARSMSASGARASEAGFHIGDLVLQQNSSGFSLSRPAPAADGRLMTYQTVFYPGAATAARASLVSVKSGEDRQGIDLSLHLVPAVRVSGTVTGPVGAGAYLGLTLVPLSGADLQSEGTAEAARTISDAAGHFTFLGIPEGQYSLKIRMYPQPIVSAPAGASADGVPAVGAGRGVAVPPPPPADPTLWAIVPVNVVDKDITDLAVVLKPGLRVTGRVEFADTKAPPTADQIQRMSIAAQSAEGRTSSPIAAAGRAAPDGTFRTSGYPAGRYIVAASTLPAGWSVKSIMSAGRDVSVEPLELTDADVSGVVITCTDQTSGVSGTVTSANGPDPNAEVIVFPADSLAWKDIGVVARRGRTERASKTGAFAATGLPAGEYFVVAVPSSAVSDWRDPKFLETLMGQATRVTLSDGENKTVTLRTVGR